MSDSGKKIRLSHLLGNPDRGALIVAFDHALVLGPIPGTEDAIGQIRRFAQSHVDGLLLNLGLIRRLASCDLQAHIPPLIARIDWSSVWTVLRDGHGEPRSSLVARPEDALRNGADAVITYMVIGTGNSEFESKEISRTAEVARECERVGIPLIVESLARGKQVENPADPKWLKMHTRIATELGADAIKTDYSGDPQSMRVVVDQCPIPILVLGGSRHTSDESALSVVQGAVQAGAAGVFFGRNVFQSPDMGDFIERARAILHNGATDLDAKRIGTLREPTPT